jgi:hypothetical protein
VIEVSGAVSVEQAHGIRLTVARAGPVQPLFFVILSEAKNLSVRSLNPREIFRFAQNDKIMGCQAIAGKLFSLNPNEHQVIQ